MRYFFLSLLTFLVVGCASDPADRLAVANQEVALLASPLKPLSEFKDFELRPIAMSDPVMKDEDKVKISEELGTKLNARITPLLNDWRAHKGKGVEGSVLIIEPIVQKLQVVSGAARFWLGAMMGDSSIDLDLKLTDSVTKQVIATPRLQQNAGAWGGAWSIGATDRNLLDYVTDIAHRYLEVNYTKQ